MSPSARRVPARLLATTAAGLLAAALAQPQAGETVADYRAVCLVASVARNVTSITSAELLAELGRLADAARVPRNPGGCTERASGPGGTLSLRFSLGRAKDARSRGWWLNVEAYRLRPPDPRPGSRQVSVWATAGVGQLPAGGETRAFWLEQVRARFAEFAARWNGRQ
jgi:hypothetical protein